LNSCQKASVDWAPVSRRSRERVVIVFIIDTIRCQY
jgi:hypothetical protein